MRHVTRFGWISVVDTMDRSAMIKEATIRPSPLSRVT